MVVVDTHRARRRYARRLAWAVGLAALTLAPEAKAEDGPLSRYLKRPVRPGPHFVDHGVLQLDAAGGWPHRYRLGVSLGVLDHLSVGATAHWLPGQRVPKVSPVIAVAAYRGRVMEVGARYFWSLYPPPVDDLDPETLSFQRNAQWILSSASFGQAALTAGFDLGVVRARVADPGAATRADGTNPSSIQWRLGGGLHLRAGTRRWGFTAQVLVPRLFAEIRFDVRFGLFEQRPRGGWKLRRSVADWDRPTG